jgi:SMI1-KNR4 cell-wall
MIKHIIAPLHAEWPDLSKMPATIAQWEAQEGRKIPADYRGFMINYGGGRPYPNVFEVAIPDDLWDSYEKTVFCNPLYAWEYAVGVWAKSTFRDGTPTGLFFIGTDPGNLQLLISLRPKDYGKVYLWVPTNDTWGSDTNNDTHLYLQAPTFTDFIMGLFDTPDSIGKDQWHTPRNEMLARDLILT